MKIGMIPNESMMSQLRGTRRLQSFDFPASFFYQRCAVLFCVQIDLVEIKEVFLQKYHLTLYKMIEDECGGDYKKLLLAVVGEG